MRVASADKAESMGALDDSAMAWRLHSVRSIGRYYGGDKAEAYVDAEKAMKVLPPGDTGWSSMAVATIFAESRWMRIKAKSTANERWEPSWLTDLEAAHAILRRHPLSDETSVTWHVDFLVWLDAKRRATHALVDGIQRFPTSVTLHERLRKHMIETRGARGLLSIYDRLVEQADEPERILPFAAVATVEAAAQYRNARQAKRALELYAKAREQYTRAVNADVRLAPYANPVIALAHAAEARLHYELDDVEASLASILASFTTHPGSAGTRDATGFTPGETAQMLRARFVRDGEDAKAAQLTTAMSTLDPRAARTRRRPARRVT